MTVNDLYAIIDRLAPFETQAGFDNSGFLVGSGNQEVSGILFALDLTEPVIDEAISRGVQLIITHHPMMITPRQRLTDGDYEGRLIRRLVRENISFIAAHTNLDQAPGGINDTLALRCGLSEVTGCGFFRCGVLASPLTARAYAAELETRLCCRVRLRGPEDALICRVGLCSGSGSDEWSMAAEAGCDAFISGEIKHHFGLAMAGSGIVGLRYR